MSDVWIAFGILFIMIGGFYLWVGLEIGKRQERQDWLLRGYKKK